MASKRRAIFCSTKYLYSWHACVGPILLSPMQHFYDSFAAYITNLRPQGCSDFIWLEGRWAFTSPWCAEQECCEKFAEVISWLPMTWIQRPDEAESALGTSDSEGSEKRKWLGAEWPSIFSGCWYWTVWAYASCVCCSRRTFITKKILLNLSIANSETWACLQEISSLPFIVPIQCDQGRRKRSTQQWLGPCCCTPSAAQEAIRFRQIVTG